MVPNTMASAILSLSALLWAPLPGHWDTIQRLKSQFACVKNLLDFTEEKGLFGVMDCHKDLQNIHNIWKRNEAREPSPAYQKNITTGLDSKNCGD